jgi:hypothetical protein
MQLQRHYLKPITKTGAIVKSGIQNIKQHEVCSLE